MATNQVREIRIQATAAASVPREVVVAALDLEAAVRSAIVLELDRAVADQPIGAVVTGDRVDLLRSKSLCAPHATQSSGMRNHYAMTRHVLRVEVS